MVINGTVDDMENLEVESDGIKCDIHHTKSYVYLGSIFTADGKLTSSLKQHAADKRKHLLKFVAFCQKNMDMPVCIKIRVMHAAFLSAILYGCEAWMNVNLKPIENLY